MVAREGHLLERAAGAYRAAPEKVRVIPRWRRARIDGRDVRLGALPVIPADTKSVGVLR